MRNKSTAQENRVAQMLDGGRRQPGSGNGDAKGDAIGSTQIAECKRTDAQEITITPAVWKKINQEGLRECKGEAVMHLETANASLFVVDKAKFICPDKVRTFRLVNHNKNLTISESVLNACVARTPEFVLDITWNGWQLVGIMEDLWLKLKQQREQESRG